MRLITIGLSALLLVACKPAASSEAASSQAAAAQTAPAAAAPAGFDYAAFEALEERWLQADKPADPIDELDWREVHCNFLAGELSGDAALDKAVNDRLEALRCMTQTEDALAVKAAKAGDPAALARLDVYFARNAPV